jgi:hypothetical protein
MDYSTSFGHALYTLPLGHARNTDGTGISYKKGLFKTFGIIQLPALCERSEAWQVVARVERVLEKGGA